MLRLRRLRRFDLRLRTRRQKNCEVSPTATTSWLNTASPTDWYPATNTTVTTPKAKCSKAATTSVKNGRRLPQRPYCRYRHLQYDSYDPLAQVRDWTIEDGESRQQTHYFHCDQIGIPREMTDKDGNLLWFDNYTGWGCLKEETKVKDSDTTLSPAEPVCRP